MFRSLSFLAFLSICAINVYADTSFIPNTLTIGARDSGSYFLFDKMVKIVDLQGSGAKLFETAWINGSFNETNLARNVDIYDSKAFKANQYSLQAGLTFFTDIFSQDYFNALSGFYLGHSNAKLSQGSDKADMSDYEFGLYSGWFGDKTTVLGSVGFDIATFNTKRKVDEGDDLTALFDSYAFKANVELDYRVNDPYKEIALKPFVGLRGGIAYNDAVFEGKGSGKVYIPWTNYYRIEALGGIKIAEDRGDFEWSARGYIGSLLAGRQASYDLGYTTIYGTKESPYIVGLGLGAKYLISKQVAVFIDAGYEFHDSNTISYTGKVGLNYFFNPIGRRIAQYTKGLNEILGNILKDKTPAQKTKEIKAEQVSVPNGQGDVYVLNTQKNQLSYINNSFKKENAQTPKNNTNTQNPKTPAKDAKDIDQIKEKIAQSAEIVVERNIKDELNAKRAQKLKKVEEQRLKKEAKLLAAQEKINKKEERKRRKLEFEAYEQAQYEKEQALLKAQKEEKARLAKEQKDKWLQEQSDGFDASRAKEQEIADSEKTVQIKIAQNKKQNQQSQKIKKDMQEDEINDRNKQIEEIKKKLKENQRLKDEQEALKKSEAQIQEISDNVDEKVPEIKTKVKNELGSK
jgi:hypothetical protein